MGVDVSVQDNRSGMDELLREVERLNTGHVDIGIFGDTNSDVVKYAAANEFGAVIKHPGGTDYGYRNAKDRKKGKVRFLHSQSRFEKATWLGATGAHTIVIPERSFIRGTFDDPGTKRRLADQCDRLTDRVLQRELSARQAFGTLGTAGQSLVRRKIKEGPWVPNAKATIRRKRSSAPLIDSRRMTNSVIYRVGGIG